MAEEIENNEIPFDMSKETLKSIRQWIDKITEISICIASGQRIDPNEMIILKQKMMQQLIVLSSPLLGKDLKEIEEFFSKIIIAKGDIKVNGEWYRNVLMYTKEIDYKLDECMKGIQESLKKYFIPVFNKGEKY